MKGDSIHVGVNSIKDTSPKGFVIGMEFCHVPKFDYSIIWYLAVDLLKLDLKMVIIFCPESRSFCSDKTPSGSLLMNGFSLWLVSRCVPTDNWRW